VTRILIVLDLFVSTEINRFPKQSQSSTQGNPLLSQALYQHVANVFNAAHTLQLKNIEHLQVVTQHCLKPHVNHRIDW